MVNFAAVSGNFLPPLSEINPYLKTAALSPLGAITVEAVSVPWEQPRMTFTRHN